MRLPASDSVERRAEESVNVALGAVRRELARQFLLLPAADLERLSGGQLGNAWRLLRSSNVRSVELIEADKDLLAGVVKSLQAAEASRPAIGPLLAAMLYLEPHELPQIVGLEAIPPWLLDEYAKFMMTPPELFRYPGEAEAYGRHMGRWLDYLHRGIFGNPRSEFWSRIGNYVLQSLNLISIYFNQLNLREVYRQRAQIFESVLRSSGHLIDYVFPPRPPRPKLRLGILAAHYAPQTETFATLPVYEHLDRRVFEIVLLTTQVTNAPLERYCISRADHFVPLPEGLPNQVQTIRNADLDFLLVATNVTAVTNAITVLAMHRLARVQIALVPSCTTSGMAHMDYYLSGRLSEPAERAQDHYTERLLVVDGPAHCYDFATESSPAPTQALTRESLGIPSDAIVFISGANFYKIIPEVQDVWIKILAATPGSRLVLYPFNPNWSSNYPVERFLERFRAAAAAHGISDDRLIVFAPAPNRADVLTRLRLADIYLDSFPFSGATSLLDPLEVGLPTVVMDGTPFRALVGPALLRTIQLEELVAPAPHAYVDLASRLAADPELRRNLRGQILEAMQAVPAFLDSKRYSDQVSRILATVWQEKQAGFASGGQTFVIQTTV